MHIYIYVFVYLSNIFMCPETAGVDRLTLLTPGLFCYIWMLMDTINTNFKSVYVSSI